MMARATADLTCPSWTLTFMRYSGTTLMAKLNAVTVVAELLPMRRLPTYRHTSQRWMRGKWPTMQQMQQMQQQNTHPLVPNIQLNS